MISKDLANFVSYHANFENRGIAAAQLQEIDISSLSTACNAALINDLAARFTVLEWQTMLENADTAFQQRRYDEALSGYNAVSKRILELIKPSVQNVGRIKIWPSGSRIISALCDASAGLLNYLIPYQKPAALLSLDKAAFDVERLGGKSASNVEIIALTSSKIVNLIEDGADAIQQGRWDDALKKYELALRSLGRGETELQAEILLNLGAVEVQLNKPSVAIRNLIQARDLFKDINDQLGTAQALHNMGLAYLVAKESDNAVKTLAEAKKVAGQANLRGFFGEKSTNNTERSINLRLGRNLTTTRTRLGLDTALNNREIILGRSFALQPAEIDTDRLATTLGDYLLKIRSISKNTQLPDIKLETEIQREQEKLGRSLSLKLGGAPVTLKWSKAEPLSSDSLKKNIYELRRKTIHLEEVGYRVISIAEIVVNLPHLYHLVLPIKIGDCHNCLGEYESAHEQYQRASSYDYINLELEAPDLWRRVAKNIMEWGDCLYRDGEPLKAVPVYELLMKEDRHASDSFLFNEDSLKPTGEKVSAWLDALANGIEPPQLNRAITFILHSIRKRWIYISSGLDFYGNVSTTVPPFSFRYLQDVARYFANRANQTEQRYIDFLGQFEQGKMTRKELENAYELSKQNRQVAQHREEEAEATVWAAVAAVTLSNLRHQNAQELLNEFEDVAQEMEAISGHIARGNAWTGYDLPNLHYSRGGLYDYSGEKHEVLQELAKHQTSISNNLQLSTMENTVSELKFASGMAVIQSAVVNARYEAARIETKIAEDQEKHAKEMRDAFNNQLFNPEQWLYMALIMKGLATTALDRGVEVARLMEHVYNFENFENLHTIQSSYKPALTNDLLGAEILLNDIDSFTHYHVTRTRQKPIPIKWGISLSEEYPGHFLRLLRTGSMEFDVDLDRVAFNHPGTFNHQLAGVELEIDGFLPPMGLHGRLTNSGLGRYRDANGQTKMRLQPAETMVISRYNRRNDAMILLPPQEMRGLFEGNSVASGWKLEIPKVSNDIDLNGIYDIRLVLYFECLFDSKLFEKDSQPPSDLHLERSRSFYLRMYFPDVFYQFRENGKANIELSASDFPYNHNNPVLSSLAIAFSTDDEISLGVTKLAVQYPGQSLPVNVTVSEQNMVLSEKLPINSGTSALGSYTIEIDSTQIEHKELVIDLILVVNYTYTPTT